MSRTGWIAAAALALAPSAFASGLPQGQSHAVLASPAPKDTEVAIDGRIWRCDGTDCTALPGDSDQRRKPVVECRDAARALGRFVAYATGDVVLTDGQLAECAAGQK
jgi:hypothetical protein